MHRLLRWTARLSLLAALVFAAAFTYETIRGAEGWPRREALANAVDNVSRDTASLDAQIKALQRQIVAERERPEVQEALVRDFLGYVRPTDVVLRGPAVP